MSFLASAVRARPNRRAPARRATSFRAGIAIAATSLLAACMSLPLEPRALMDEPDGVRVISFDCGVALRTAREALPPSARRLDPAAIRVLTWNLHKQEDAGWGEDLTRFAAASDVLLLQEVALVGALQQVLRREGLRFVMGSSFIYEDADYGVLTATRVAPVAACTQRIVEPLLRIPKSAVIAWLPVAGMNTTLAVANVHSINFALTLDAYDAQLDALVDVLAQHDGPIVLGGDLNTWSAARLASVRRTATRLGLVEIAFVTDGRTRFLGQQVDHLLVRGLAVTSSATIAVKSSDHNPAGALLTVVR